jgi:hypothetical protein
MRVRCDIGERVAGNSHQITAREMVPLSNSLTAGSSKNGCQEQPLDEPGHRSLTKEVERRGLQRVFPTRDDTKPQGGTRWKLLGNPEASLECSSPADLCCQQRPTVSIASSHPLRHLQILTKRMRHLHLLRRRALRLFSDGRAVRASPRHPRLVSPACTSMCSRSVGSTRFCISSKRHPTSPSRTPIQGDRQSVAPSPGQSLLDYRLTIHTHPGNLPFLASTPPSRRGVCLIPNLPSLQSRREFKVPAKRIRSSPSSRVVRPLGCTQRCGGTASISSASDLFKSRLPASSPL